MSKPEQTYRLDRTVVSIIPMEEQDDDSAYWATKTPEERWRALEFLRQTAYGAAARARLQRVLEFAQRGED